MTQSNSESQEPVTGPQRRAWPSATQAVRQVIIVLVVVVVWALLFSGFLQVSGPLFGSVAETSALSEVPEDVSFADHVQPILERRCVKCHGGERTEEGLVMTSYEDLINGSWNGPVIEPGDSENSYLIEQITTGEMPKNEPSLLPTEIRTIAAWVDDGAEDN
jgi:hypothetical protein